MPRLLCRVLSTGGVPEGYEAYVPSKRPVLTVQPIPDTSNKDGSTPQVVYDFKFDRATCKWVPWVDTITPLAIPAGAGFSDIMVPTKDTARCVYQGMINATTAAVRFG